jgi:hypothetical protein
MKTGPYEASFYKRRVFDEIFENKFSRGSVENHDGFLKTAIGVY